MIAVDTNILVYAHRRDSPWHEASARVVKELAEGRASWAIPWPCLHEFFAIVTHPRIYAPPSTSAQAVAQIAAWVESPSVVLLSESAGYWAECRAILESSRIAGPQVHDARIVALCSLHGARELLTADRDFSRFPHLAVRNPLIGMDRR